MAETKNDAKKGDDRRLRYWLISGVIIVAIGLGYAIVKASPQGLTNPSSLLGTLVWVALIIVAILYFEAPITGLLASLIRKIDSAERIRFSKWLDIRVDVKRIPVPRETQTVTLDNVALLHTSFLRQDKTIEYNDGMTYYQIEVILLAPEAVLDRVEKVTYYLDESYPNPVRTEDDRKSRFKLKELANGTSIVRATVEFRAQAEPLHLNRFIDLRPEGPRI